MEAPTLTSVGTPAPVEERLARIEQMLERQDALLRQVPDLVATLTNMADAHISGLRAQGVDIDTRLNTAVALLERLTDPQVTDALNLLLEPRNASLASSWAQAIDGAAKIAPQPVGLMGALSAARRSDTKSALGFFMAVAERFGASLNDTRRLRNADRKGLPHA